MKARRQRVAASAVTPQAVTPSSVAASAAVSAAMPTPRSAMNSAQAPAHTSSAGSGQRKEAESFSVLPPLPEGQGAKWLRRKTLRLSRDGMAWPAGRQSQYARNFTRNRAIDWLCNWQTRDSVTLSTEAISFRFMSCS